MDDCHSVYAVGDVIWRCELSDAHCGPHYSHAESPSEVRVSGTLPNREPISRVFLSWDQKTASLSFA